MSTQNLYNQIKSKKKGIDMSFMKDIPSAGKSFVNETTWGVSTKTPTFRKETAQSTQAIPDKSTPSTYNTVRDFGREILKDVGATGAGYDMRKGVDLKREFDPKTSRLGRMFGSENVYGTDKPFSISSQSESFSDLLGVESEKGKERVASIYGTLNLMDYVGVGVTKNVAEEAFKTIAKSTDRTVIAKVLRNTFTGFDKKIADDVAIALDDVTDRNQVQAIIEKVMEVQKAKQPVMSKYSYTNLPPAKADEVVVSFVETGGDKQYINTVVENTKQYDGVPHFGTISRKLLNDTGDVNKTRNGVYTIPRALANKIVLEDTIPQAKRVPIRGERGQFLGSFMDAPAKQTMDSLDPLNFKSADEFVKAQGAPKTVKVWNKSKFSNDGAYADVPVVRKEEEITLYQGGSAEGRQFWTPNRKYAEQFGEVKEKTGTFYKIDNGNRVTDVYVEAPTKSQLTEIWNKANQSPAKQAFTENGIEFDRTIREIEKRLEEIFGRKIDINTTVDEDFLRAKKNKGDTSVTVYGRANAEAIYLLERNKTFSEAVANHEGWHWFKRNLSDTKRKELDALEQELMDARPDLVAKVKREYPDATPQELAEEVMADEFARYTRTGKTVSEKLKLFFDNAVEALLRVFKVRDDVMSRAEKEFSRVKKTLKTDSGVGAGKSAAKQTKDTLDPKNYKSAEEFVKAKLPNKKVTENPNNYGETKTYKVLENSYNKKEPSVTMPKGSMVFRGGDDGVFHSADLGTAEGYAIDNAPISAVDISGKKLANFQIFTDGKYASDPNIDLASVLKKALNDGYDGLYSRDNYGEVILPTKSQLTEIWNKANEAPAKQTKETTDPKNYKSAEEFVKAKTTRPDYGYGHSPNEDGVRAFDLTEKVNGEQMIPADMYEQWYGSRGTPEDLESIAVLKKIKGNPEAEVTIYRAGPKEEWNYGDWTTFSKKYAQTHAEGNNLKVFSKKVKAKDVRWAMDDVNEFGYFPEDYKSQLTEIWNKANEAPAKQVSNVDRLIAEGKIRVVSRDGRDVYQTQEGGKWVNRRDEDSAIKSLQPKPSKAIQVDPKLEERLLSAQISKEMLQEDPASALERYAVPTNRFVEKEFKDYRGQLPEVTGIDSRDPRAPLLRDTALKAERKLVKGKDYVNFKIGGDRYLSELGFNDTEEAREAYSKFLIRKADVEVELKEAREAIKTARLEQKARLGESKAIAELTEPVYQRVPDTPEAIRTLENQAQEALAGVEFSPNQKPLTLHEIVTRTPLQAKVNIVDYIRTPDRVLKKIGFAKEAKLLRDGYDKYVVELPTNIQKITDWSEGLPKEASERIFRYLDGEDVVLPENEKKIAGEMKVWLKQWADRLGLPDDNRITNYITHIFDEELIAKEFDEDLAKIITEKIPGQVYDPFLEKRLGAKGYKQDVWQALDAYTKRATRKVHIDPALQKIQDKAGSSLEFSNLEKSNFDFIQKYVSRVNMRPTEIDSLIDTTLKQLFGYRMGQRPVARITRFMRHLTYSSFLGGNLGSALRNLSQGVNIYAVLGERDTALGYLKLFSAENRRELAEQGIFANNFIQDRTINATRKLIEKADKGLWVFFDTAEKINRGSAYLGAKTKALRQGMAEQEAIDYAKSIVRKTQFNYDPVDTPVALSSDIVKTLLQFQTYTVKQTEFLTELAKDKNFVALARYALAGYGFVYTIGQAFGMEPKELLPINTDTWSRFELAPSLKIPKEIAKALMNVPDDYGSERDLEEKMKDIADTLWGLVPAGAQLKKSIKGYGALEEGGSFDSAGRKQFEVGGTTAKDTQAILFGKYANKEAKQYFDKDSGDNTFDKLKEKDLETKKEERTRLTQDVDALRDASKEEVKARLLELAKEDEAYAEKVLDALVEEKQGLSSIEKKLKNASVNVRAEYIMDKIDGLSKEEKKAMVQEYYTKGIFTEAVLDKMIEMMGEGDIIE